MIDLVEVIKSECLPERNCMLTVEEISGDAGFLYFKEAQLIEASCGGEWGNTAFAEILSWNVETYSLHELPMGIKRTLWEPVDKLIEDVRGAGAGDGVRSAVQNLPDAEVQQEPDVMLDSHSEHLARFQHVIEGLKQVPGFTCLFHEAQGKIRLLSGVVPDEALTGAWLLDFTEECEALGTGLGGGALQSWEMGLKGFRAHLMSYEGEFMFVISSADVDVAEFREGCEDVMETTT